MWNLPFLIRSRCCFLRVSDKRKRFVRHMRVCESASMNTPEVVLHHLVTIRLVYELLLVFCLLILSIFLLFKDYFELIISQVKFIALTIHDNIHHFYVKTTCYLLIKLSKSDIFLNSPRHLTYNIYTISILPTVNHFIHNTYLSLFHIFSLGSSKWYILIYYTRHNSHIIIVELSLLKYITFFKSTWYQSLVKV